MKKSEKEEKNDLNLEHLLPKNLNFMLRFLLSAMIHYSQSVLNFNFHFFFLFYSHSHSHRDLILFFIFCYFCNNSILCKCDSIELE